ncbi:hypothetical protein HZH66_007944 [Vespula vulgaris]|uniref:Uncharacterized protein n=1 Tax=Vespula vulgaris TaxID=7454 RepID=A0A834N2X2_VESVU|nr:hypothetical protein HZH66_007944 [Vespula vulgaris]
MINELNVKSHRVLARRAKATAHCQVNQLPVAFSGIRISLSRTVATGNRHTVSVVIPSIIKYLGYKPQDNLPYVNKLELGKKKQRVEGNRSI